MSSEKDLISNMGEMRGHDAAAKAAVLIAKEAAGPGHKGMKD